ncbi:hypothetical protein cand_018540 [Cryptosporidium andersoni]|uniref:VTT domain-containing protein n=1 Tax=Cryptosporidium andersoni TaxID=117008 RepID=A0A1J4MAL5_9CRYT|nr:hypothetical protein cand_018540 [Cryptosporidium andersoni]
MTSYLPPDLLPETPLTRTHLVYGLIAFKIIIFLLIVGILLISILYSDDTIVIVENFSKTIINNGLPGTILYIISFSILTSLFFPMEPLILSTAFFLCKIYGSKLGIIITLSMTLCGAALSASLSVFLTRFICYSAIKSILGSHNLYMALNSTVKERGLTFIIFLRLSPIVPFTISNYILGLTDLKYVDLIFGTIGCLPNHLALIILSSSISNTRHNKCIFCYSWKYGIIGLVGLILTLLTFLYIIFETRRRLTNIFDDDQSYSFHSINDEPQSFEYVIQPCILRNFDNQYIDYKS